MVTIFDLFPPELRVEIADRLPLNQIKVLNQKITSVGDDPFYFPHRAQVKFGLSNEQYDLLYKEASHNFSHYPSNEQFTNYSLTLFQEPTRILSIVPSKRIIHIPRYLDPGMEDYIPETQEGYYPDGYQPDDLTYASVYYLDLDGFDHYLDKSLGGEFLTIDEETLLDLITIVFFSPNGTPEQKADFATDLIEVIEKYDYDSDLDDILEDPSFNEQLKKYTGNSLVH